MTESDEDTQLRIEQLQQTWLQRARGILIGRYGSTEIVEIYGLKLQRVQGDSRYYDVVYPKDSDGEATDIAYIDTIDIDQFSSARQILKQIQSYYPDDTALPDEPEDDDSEPADTTGAAFQ